MAVAGRPLTGAGAAGEGLLDVDRAERGRLGIGAERSALLPDVSGCTGGVGRVAERLRSLAVAAGLRRDQPQESVGAGDAGRVVAGRSLDDGLADRLRLVAPVLVGTGED